MWLTVTALCAIQAKRVQGGMIWRTPSFHLAVKFHLVLKYCSRFPCLRHEYGGVWATASVYIFKRRRASAGLSPALNAPHQFFCCLNDIDISKINNIYCPVLKMYIDT